MPAPAASDPGTEPDFTMSPEAQRNRAGKAARIFRYCWENDVEPLVMVDPKDRRRIAREAGGYRLRRGKRAPVWSDVSEETWQQVVALYRRERDRTWLQRALRS